MAKVKNLALKMTVKTAKKQMQMQPPTNQDLTMYRRVKTGTTIFIPHDIFKKPGFVSNQIRNGITPTAAAASLHSLIETCDGDPSRVNLSYSTVQRYKFQVHQI